MKKHTHGEAFNDGILALACVVKNSKASPAEKKQVADCLTLASRGKPALQKNLREADMLNQKLADFASDSDASNADILAEFLATTPTQSHVYIGSALITIKRCLDKMELSLEVLSSN